MSRLPTVCHRTVGAGDIVPLAWPYDSKEVRMSLRGAPLTAWRTRSAAFVGGLGLAFALGCGDSTSGPDGDQTEIPLPTSIQLSPDEVRFTWIGEGTTVTATVFDQNGGTMPSASVSWTTGTPTVATVDGAGRVQAVATGSTVVTASAGSARSTLPVSVEQVPASLDISVGELRLIGAGDTARLVASVKDQGGTVAPGHVPVWSSSDPTVAEIDSQGLVTAAGVGTATVTAALNALSASTSVKVEKAAAAMDVAAEADTLTFIGATTAVSASVSDEDGVPIPDATVTWGSATPQFLAVSATGEVTALAPGSGAIVGSYGSLSDTAFVHVVPRPASVVILPDSVELTWLGETAEFRGEVRDAGGTPVAGLTVGWASSIPGVAGVDAGGQVTAVWEGATNVTASYGALAANATVVVRQIPTSVQVWKGTETDSMYVLLGERALVSLAAWDAGGSPVLGRTPSWAIRNLAVASSESGEGGSAWVHGLAVGESWFVGALDSVSDSMIVRVVQPDDYPIAYIRDGDILRVTAFGGDPQHMSVPHWAGYLLSWAPDGNSLTYGSSGDIFLIREDGTGASVLVDDPTWYTRPLWSPDGEWVGFEDQWSGSRRGIFRIRPDGTDRQRVTPDSVLAAWFDWSPAGDRVVFVGVTAGVPGVYVVNVDGTDLRLLQATSHTQRVSWSPTGDRVAFDQEMGEGNWDVFSVALDGTGLVNLTNTSTISESDPQWSPDGTQVAFQALAGVGARRELHVVNGDGSGRENWTPEHAHNHDRWVWSPRGDALLASIGFVSGGYLEVTHRSGARSLGKGDWPAWHR